jgi:hypothetical protein
MDDLIARLTHAEQPTPAMEAGRAFAKLMERHPDGPVDDSLVVDGWRFFFDEVDADLSRAALREIKAEKVYATPDGPVTLVAKADGVNGRTVHDQKLTGRWDAEKYLESLQWRAYLDLFDADTFVYDVFVGKVDDRRQTVNVTDYHRLAFYRYPQLGRDVERAVRDLAAVIAEYVPSLITVDAKDIA